MATDGSKHARSGTGAIWATLTTILVIEAILDIVLLPADEILVPAEAVGDVVFIGVSLLSTFASGKATGRQIGSRRGAAGLQRNRLGLGGSGVAVVGFWAFFLAILVFQWWFAVHHPVLTVLLFVFELGFDLLLLVVGIVLTAAFFLAPRADSGREVGA